MDVLAPAKINLTLRVLGKRPDGYHALESVMQMLTLADRITIRDADQLIFTCSDHHLATEDNLVMRAAKLLQRRCPSSRGARIHLEKHIPAQAGLGGGSSDAAATLAALNEFWDIRLPDSELAELAAELGSDVPFFLYTPCAVVRGRGETIIPVKHPFVASVVLVKLTAGLSTPQVYTALQANPASHGEGKAEFRAETRAMLLALEASDIDAVALATMNDLQQPAVSLLPELRVVREQMLAAGCLCATLCGSGSAVFGLCADNETAFNAAEQLSAQFPWTWSGPWMQFH